MISLPESLHVLKTGYEKKRKLALIAIIILGNMPLGARLSETNLMFVLLSHSMKMECSSLLLCMLKGEDL
jgi:hypothetical protein